MNGHHQGGGVALSLQPQQLHLQDIKDPSLTGCHSDPDMNDSSDPIAAEDVDDSCSSPAASAAAAPAEPEAAEAAATTTTTTSSSKKKDKKDKEEKQPSMYPPDWWWAERQVQEILAEHPGELGQSGIVAVVS